MSDIRWIVKVSFTTEIDMGEAWTEAGAKDAARRLVATIATPSGTTADVEAEVTAVRIGGKAYVAPPF